MPEQSKPTCFIAMPVTTPDALIPQYGGDADHFQHVLEHLFEPAVWMAGMEPVRPTMHGSQLIHAKIIEHLETADLVLVDLSTHNPNVLFEFGIRTSFNKPICVVRDSKTGIPFDTGPVQTHLYDGRLDPWVLEAEIPELAAHLKKSAEVSGQQNPFWQHFGFKLEAARSAGPKSWEHGFELLRQEIASVKDALSDQLRFAANLALESARSETLQESTIFKRKPTRLGLLSAAQRVRELAAESSVVLNYVEPKDPNRIIVGLIRADEREADKFRDEVEETLGPLFRVSVVVSEG